MSEAEREVRDTMGTMRVPAAAYYGAQTARAVENFRLTGHRAHPELIRGLAAIKWAAARANGRLGLLSEERCGAIEAAAREIFDGRLHDQFVVDAINAGAGTSIHMNANEVIANRACEILGLERDRTDRIHPNDHVNLGQSTNDVVPTAIRLAGSVLAGRLVAETAKLAGAFADRARAFDRIVKSGRTHLQDAVPIRLGQEFGGYALSVARRAERLGGAIDGARELGIGGSAAGTGLNTHPDYARIVVDELSSLYGIDLRQAEDRFEAMQSQAPLVDLAAAARALAVELLRITNDLRLLASGPRTGLAEIRLPAVQPGSSIMPGKVNPVIAESTAMACYQAVGCDAVVAAAAQAGQLELNVMMPVIGQNLLFALDLLANAAANLRERCVEGIEADEERCRLYAESSVAIATILSPILGYDKAAEVVKTALEQGKSIRSVLEEGGILPPERIDEVLDLLRWTEPGRLEE